MNEYNITTYKFSLSNFKIHNRKGLIGYIVFFVVLCLVILTFLTIDFFRNGLVKIAWLIIFYIMFFALFSIPIVKRVKSYLSADKVLGSDYIAVKECQGKVFSLQVHFNEYGYDVYYSVNEVASLIKKRGYIDIEGEICAEFIYSDRSDNLNRNFDKIRIPAYFDNMDEIYHSLLRLKEQTPK